MHMDHITRNLKHIHNDKKPVTTTYNILKAYPFSIWKACLPVKQTEITTKKRLNRNWTDCVKPDIKRKQSGFITFDVVACSATEKLDRVWCCFCKSCHSFESILFLQSWTRLTFERNGKSATKSGKHYINTKNQTLHVWGRNYCPSFNHTHFTCLNSNAYHKNTSTNFVCFFFLRSF